MRQINPCISRGPSYQFASRQQPTVGPARCRSPPTCPSTWAPRRSMPPGPFVAGSYAELILTYTAGTFGIDDTGIVKISWRTTSDMGKPQFTDPAAANYTTVEAEQRRQARSAGSIALNIRPWANTHARSASAAASCAAATPSPCASATAARARPGYRLQTNVERAIRVQGPGRCLRDLRIHRAAAVSPRSTSCPDQRSAGRRSAVARTIVGEPFRLAIVAEDLWGNPTGDATWPAHAQAVAADRRTARARR